MTTNTRHSPSEQDLAVVLGSRIKELRGRQGLSQRMLAQQLGISKSMVAKYEGGVHAPPVGSLVQLAALLDVTLDGLLGRDLRDPRLVRCLMDIETMDEESRGLVTHAIELVVNAYRVISARRAAPEQPR